MARATNIPNLRSLPPDKRVLLVCHNKAEIRAQELRRKEVGLMDYTYAQSVLSALYSRGLLVLGRVNSRGVQTYSISDAGRAECLRVLADLRAVLKFAAEAGQGQK